MKLKTYVAPDAQAALAQVRKELGPEAVILSTQSRCLPASGPTWPRHRSVEITAAVGRPDTLDSPPVFQAWPQNPTTLDVPFLQLREELQEMKSILRQWVGAQDAPAWLASYGELNHLFQYLVRVGIHDRIIFRWLEGVRTSLTQEKNKPIKDLKELALRQLLQEIEVKDLWKLSPHGPRRWTFLGSTGVGKTTTIAKLAIHATFVRRLGVGLISLDNIRLGGLEQLASYARLSDLPFAAVQTRSELAESLQKMADLDLVLIDTPGRNPCDPDLSKELNRLFGGLPELDHHLVVSGTTKEDNLADAFQGFKALPLASCITTRLDESKDIVGVFNQLCTRRVPLSYLTTGQRIPEDLEPATRRRLAGLLLGPYSFQKIPGGMA
jgi:flagellar biosynthesis protein FlhF